MKKVITLCLFVFAMILGTESTMAQTSAEINNEAAETTKSLKKILKLDKAQLDKNL